MKSKWQRALNRPLIGSRIDGPASTRALSVAGSQCEPSTKQLLYEELINAEIVKLVGLLDRVTPAQQRKFVEQILAMLPRAPYEGESHIDLSNIDLFNERR